MVFLLGFLGEEGGFMIFATPIFWALIAPGLAIAAASIWGIRKLSAKGPAARRGRDQDE